MDFRPTEEQEQLASTLRSLLARHADSAAVRAAVDTATGHDPILWELLCQQIGAAALCIPEDYDGAGFSVLETCVVLDELGRSLAPSPLLATLVATEALLAAGDDATCERLLPRIASGVVATIAWSGPRGPGLAEPVHADGTALTGTVTDVLFGDVAEVLLVAARTRDWRRTVRGRSHNGRSHVHAGHGHHTAARHAGLRGHPRPAGDR